MGQNRNSLRLIFFTITRNFVVTLFLSVLLTSGSNALTKHLEPSDTLNKKRLNSIIISGSIGLTATTIALDRLWYADYPRSSFHFYDDNHHWKQMDKVGHAATAYWLGYHGMQALRWAGVDDKKAIWYGGSMGLPFLTVVEILDGFSANWGFAWGDQAANFLGSAALISQELTWGKQKIQLKYSFSRSGLAPYRPSLLGESLMQEAIKDYNGQTYWISFPLTEINPTSVKLPDWLNIALGYSAQNMLGAVENPAYYNGEPLPDITRYRQYYISLDMNILEFETSYPLLNAVLNAASFIKVPFPALEYNSIDGFRGHWFYF